MRGYARIALPTAPDLAVGHPRLRIPSNSASDVLMETRLQKKGTEVWGKVLDKGSTAEDAGSNFGVAAWVGRLVQMCKNQTQQNFYSGVCENNDRR